MCITVSQAESEVVEGTIAKLKHINKKTIVLYCVKISTTDDIWLTKI